MIGRLQGSIEGLLLAIRRRGSERCLRCGSTIQFKGDGMRFAMAFRSKKVYSTEGELLREEQR